VFVEGGLQIVGIGVPVVHLRLVDVNMWSWCFWSLVSCAPRWAGSKRDGKFFDDHDRNSIEKTAGSTTPTPTHTLCAFIVTLGLPASECKLEAGVDRNKERVRLALPRDEVEVNVAHELLSILANNATPIRRRGLFGP